MQPGGTSADIVEIGVPRVYLCYGREKVATGYVGCHCWRKIQAFVWCITLRDGYAVFGFGRWDG